MFLPIRSAFLPVSGAALLLAFAACGGKHQEADPPRPGVPAPVHPVTPPLPATPRLQVPPAVAAGSIAKVSVANRESGVRYQWEIEGGRLLQSEGPEVEIQAGRGSTIRVTCTAWRQVWRGGMGEGLIRITPVPAPSSPAGDDQALLRPVPLRPRPGSWVSSSTRSRTLTISFSR